MQFFQKKIYEMQSSFIIG